MIFPFLILAYGLVMTAILSTPVFNELAETRLPASVNQQLKAHRGLGLFCLLAGAFWSLQNLWL